MLSTISLLILSAALPSLSLPLALPPRSSNGTNIRQCGTGPPSDTLLDAHATLHTAHRLEPRKASLAKEIIVDTCIHFVTTTDQAAQYAPEDIATLVARQGSVLNTAYADSNITFLLHPYSHTINDGWATDVQDSAMKTALRRGSYAALNIYFQTNLSAGITTPGAQASQLLGYCTLPQSVAYTPSACPSDAKLSNGNCKPQTFPKSTYILDGCNVLAGSMPGGGLQGYQMGKTAVHEVGHWFGLLHTFQGNTCAASDAGDFVDDTPQESVSTDGCPPAQGMAKDSCPGVEGLDPVHNYMDYSNDECYTGFSPMQQTRMLNMFNLFRKGN